MTTITEESMSAQSDAHHRSACDARIRIFLYLLLLESLPGLHAADIELTETLQLSECHSLRWVRENTQAKDQKNWDGVLDELKWGTPSAQQLVVRNWDWKTSDEQWREAVRKKARARRRRLSLIFGCPVKSLP